MEKRSGKNTDSKAAEENTTQKLKQLFVAEDERLARINRENKAWIERGNRAARRNGWRINRLKEHSRR